MDPPPFTPGVSLLYTIHGAFCWVMMALIVYNMTTTWALATELICLVCFLRSGGVFPFPCKRHVALFVMMMMIWK